MKHRYWVAGLALLVGLAVAAGAAARTHGTAKASATKVTLQLKWVTQAQFAGYYAAKAKGFYTRAGLDVNVKVGGPAIKAEQVVLGKQADFGIDWVPSLLSFSDTGKKIVDIAQVFSRSGMTELTWKDSGITTIKQMRGKKVGVWCCGNENELYAALVKNGMDPKNKSDVTIVNQPFDMNLFLSREVDAAAALTYNELAQVLEQKNPKTFNRTARLAQQFGVIKNAPSGAYRTDIAKAAVALLKKQGLDVYGKKWKKAKVKVTEGGK